MTYIFLIIFATIFTIIFLGLFFIFFLAYRFHEGCNNIETFSSPTNFLPFLTTDTKISPFVHYNYPSTKYNRENLLAGNLPIDKHTLTVGISMRNKNTLHRYIFNHLLKKIILYKSKQLKVLDIDYTNDMQVLQDLDNFKLTYGIISKPVIYNYLYKQNKLYSNNLEFITTLTKNFIYGITLDNRKINTIYDLEGKKIGTTKKIITEKIVLKDLLDNICHDIKYNFQLIECRMEKLLLNLYNGLIDFFIIIGEFPSDIIRNLLLKYRNVRLVDLNMKNNSQFISRKPYQRATLNTRLLNYRERNVFSHLSDREYLPVINEYSAYTRNHPHILTYQFFNCLLTNNANRMITNYEIIFGIHQKLYNNRKIGSGYLSENQLHKHIKLGPSQLPITIQPAVKDFYSRIRYGLD